MLVCLSVCNLPTKRSMHLGYNTESAWDGQRRHLWKNPRPYGKNDSVIPTSAGKFFQDKAGDSMARPNGAELVGVRSPLHRQGAETPAKRGCFAGVLFGAPDTQGTAIVAVLDGTLSAPLESTDVT